MDVIKLLRLILLVGIAAVTPLSASHAQSAGDKYYVISVDFGTAPENFARFKEMMKENAMSSVANEPGCREFDVYELANVPDHLFLYEVYENEAAFRDHLKSSHYKRFNEETASIIASRAVNHGLEFVAYHKPR